MCVSTELMLRVGLCVCILVGGGRLVVKVVVIAVLLSFITPINPSRNQCFLSRAHFGVVLTFNVHMGI